MSYQVRVSGQQIAFACAAEQTILDAAEAAGYALPFSCRKGVCLSCEGGLVAGAALQRGRGSIAGPRSGVLFCQARPRSDVEIAPKRIGLSAAPERKTIEALVFRLTRPTADVTVLHVRYKPQDRVHFRAGQHLQVLLGDGARRNYSMAGAPQERDGTMLHVSRIAGGCFSDRMVATLAPGSRLRLELPFGQAAFDDAETRPAILLATGTGIAPITSVIEDRLRRGVDRPLTLYWGVRGGADLFLGERLPRGQRELPQLHIIPVLSRPDPGWTGRVGHVQRAVLEDYSDLSRHVVYACGNPAMVQAARALLTQERGLPSGAYRADAFAASGD